MPFLLKSQKAEHGEGPVKSFKGRKGAGEMKREERMEGEEKERNGKLGEVVNV